MAVRGLSTAIGAFALLASAGSARGGDSMHHHHPTHPLIVDTDMALDDVRALFALLADPDLDLRGVSTVEGSASVGRGTDNLLGMLEACGVVDVAVLRGESLEGGQPPRWRDRVDGLRGATFAPPRGRIEARPAADGLPGLIGGAERPVILALGPLPAYWKITGVDIRVPGEPGRTAGAS